MTRASFPWLIKEISGYLRTHKKCNAVVLIEPYSLAFVPDRFKTEGMCIKAVEADPSDLRYIPDHLKTQEMEGRERPNEPGLCT